jgi:hypothetical protein
MFSGRADAGGTGTAGIAAGASCAQSLPGTNKVKARKSAVKARAIEGHAGIKI